MTYKAQAYHIKCIYQTGEQNVTLGFNVSMLTTAGTIANTGPPPVCVMKIVAQNGNEINSAEIGDNLMLQVEVQPSSESFKANCSIRFSFSALYSLSSMNQCFKQLVKCCRLYGKKKKKKKQLKQIPMRRCSYLRWIRAQLHRQDYGGQFGERVRGNGRERLRDGSYDIRRVGAEPRDPVLDG